MTVVKDQPVRSDSHRTASARRLAVTVLRGGPSRERAVSLQSGAAVAVALESAGYDVVQTDISPDSLSALDRRADVVFVALHGQFGEDGDVQRLLEQRGLCYTGSNSAACALAMNKAAAKRRFIEVGLPTPRFDVATADDVRCALAAWTLPLVVKPVREGSSIHCHIVRDVIELRPAAEQVIAEYGEALIEEYIPGLELTVGILGDEALPPIEIRPAAEFYDYHAKYESDDTRYSFDIALPENLLRELGEMSLAAHRALGCRDFSRVDWRVDPHSGRPYILEVNSIPGFTSHSLLPMAARRRGMDMPELCRRIVEMALRRGA
ncbi:MAG: D-alanine--D-alanine ligase [Phycisphaerae bacterium]|nr:D-alanine--D-alanine ligase [Phycisphaerae bacterium]NUQ45264.1 D-alanine--D-alanine ligase [Phycisphaerae bacterium]